jgi:hypothetical protein
MANLTMVQSLNKIAANTLILYHSHHLAVYRICRGSKATWASVVGRVLHVQLMGLTRTAVHIGLILLTDPGSFEFAQVRDPELPFIYIHTRILLSANYHCLIFECKISDIKTSTSCEGAQLSEPRHFFNSSSLLRIGPIISSADT